MATTGVEPTPEGLYIKVEKHTLALLLVTGMQAADLIPECFELAEDFVADVHVEDAEYIKFRLRKDA